MRWLAIAALVTSLTAAACDEPPAGPPPDAAAPAAPAASDSAAAKTDPSRADVTITAALIERRAVGDVSGWAMALAAERRDVKPKLMRDGVAFTGRGAGSLKATVRPGFQTTFEGGVLIMRVERAELLVHTEAIARGVLELLPEVERRGVLVERADEGITVRALPRSVTLSLAAQASYARINELFGPYREELGELSLFAEGNSTVRARNSDGGGRERLSRWLARIPRATDVRFVLRDFCREEGARDLGVEVVGAPAPLSGAFVRRVFTTKDAIITEVEAKAGERLSTLANGIAANNQTAMLVWGDRVLWWSWAAVLHPFRESRQHWTRYDLATRAPEQSCATPSLEEIAAHVRAAALIEEARAGRR